MAKFNSLKPLTVGAALVASAVAATTVSAAENPFATSELQSGYQMADNNGQTTSEEMKKDKEGKCGANKKAADDKAKEGSCGANKKVRDDKAKEGSCGANKKGE